MGKKLKLEDPKTGKVEWVDEDNITFISFSESVKRGDFGRKEQYKYFCDHPDEVEDQKLFSELEKEFGDDNIEET